MGGGEGDGVTIGGRGGRGILSGKRRINKRRRDRQSIVRTRNGSLRRKIILIRSNRQRRLEIRYYMFMENNIFENENLDEDELQKKLEKGRRTQKNS